MPYDIEVMSIGEDKYPVLKRAVESLNRVQDQFRFRLTPKNQRDAGLGLKREKYVTEDIWKFLRGQRRTTGGHRPFIVAFVTGPLESLEWANIFGDHVAKEGLAVATTDNAWQYVREEARFCAYYLVRYALSFVNWEIKSHNDAARADCYFNFKKDKRELRASMDSGKICDACMAQLDDPQPDSPVHKLSNDEREALKKMRQCVQGEYPHALIMKGGGVKGLALAGALIELEKYFWFDRHVGTSAGAIGAILLAAGFTPIELRDLLLNKDFRDFLDAPRWRLLPNLICKYGLYPGESFRLWIANLLTQKLKLQSEVAMKDLHGAVIYAGRAGQGTVTFDSSGERSDTVASFAVRCSMSIPLFFIPTNIEGRRVYDGGLRHNFPLKRFLETHEPTPFVALYLGKPDNRNNRAFGLDMLDIVVDGDETKVVDDHRQDIVVIDTTPIGTVDFNMTEAEKDFLLSVGRAAALQFLVQRKLDDGPSLEEANLASREAGEKRELVTVARTRRRHQRRATVIFWIIILAVAGLIRLWSGGFK
jgi:predicted acylesterase/phospholipase RssA